MITTLNVCLLYTIIITSISPYFFAGSTSISTHPLDQTVDVSGNATFSVVVDTGPGNTFEWFFGGNLLSDGNDIDGATTDTLTIMNVVQADAGNYFVRISNSPSEPVDSNPAILTVVCKLNNHVSACVASVVWWYQGKRTHGELMHVGKQIKLRAIT